MRDSISSRSDPCTYPARRAVPVAALRARRRRPARAVGYLSAWLVGVVLLVQLFVTVHPVLDQLRGTCGCEPLFEQLTSGP
jgi:hypothetical protein